MEIGQEKKSIHIQSVAIMLILLLKVSSGISEFQLDIDSKIHMIVCFLLEVGNECEITSML